MLTIFNPLPHMIFQWDKLFKENFMGGVVLHKGLMIRLCQGAKRFTNNFSSNLKTIVGEEKAPTIP